MNLKSKKSEIENGKKWAIRYKKSQNNLFK